MKCPYCGEEMIKGFLMSSRDITFAIDKRDCMENNDNPSALTF